MPLLNLFMECIMREAHSFEETQMTLYPFSQTRVFDFSLDDEGLGTM